MKAARAYAPRQIQFALRLGFRMTIQETNQTGKVCDPNSI